MSKSWKAWKLSPPSPSLALSYHSLWEKLPAMSEVIQAIYGEAHTIRNNSHVREQPSKHIVQLQVSLPMAVASAHVGLWSHQRPQACTTQLRPLPSSWPTATGKYKSNICCFKPLCFGVICYAIDDIIFFHLFWDDSLLKHRLEGVLFFTPVSPTPGILCVLSVEWVTVHLMTSLSPILYGYLYIQIHTQKQERNSSIKKETS